MINNNQLKAIFQFTCLLRGQYPLITLNQSEASFQVTWSPLTNQRLRIRLEFSAWSGMAWLRCRGQLADYNIITKTLSFYVTKYKLKINPCSQWDDVKISSQLLNNQRDLGISSHWSLGDIKLRKRDGPMLWGLLVIHTEAGESGHNLRGWEKLEENSRYYSNWDKFQACFWLIVFSSLNPKFVRISTHVNN